MKTEDTANISFSLFEQMLQFVNWQPEPIDLLDLYVGAKWSVLVPESLPSRSTSSPPQDRVVELCVTDIDERRMHEILYALI